MVITGRSVILVALGGLLLFFVPSVTTVLFWILGVSILFSFDALLAASPRTVAITRTVHSPVRLSQTTTVELMLTNLGSRQLRGTLRDAWQPTAGPAAERHRITIPAGEARRVTTRLTPKRRGDLHTDHLTIRTLGPLRLGGRQASLTVPGKLRVLPEFKARRHLPSKLMLLREMDGAASVQVRGQGTEFDSLREYVPGDDVRSIDWRATARRAEVVVRTWRPERDRRVLVVVDSSRTSAARVGDGARLDASIEAALLLGALTSRAGDRVGLMAIDRQVRARVPLNLGSDVLSTFADTLAPVFPRLVEVDWPLIAGLVSSQLSQRSLVVLLTALDPAAVESGLLSVATRLARDHQVVVASVADPEIEDLRAKREDIEDVFIASAAERVKLGRIAMGRMLGQVGVEVVEATPDELAPKLADKYLALKAAGKL